MKVLVIGGGRRAKIIVQELPVVGCEVINVTTAEQAYEELRTQRCVGAIIGPEFSPNDVRIMGKEMRAIAGQRKLHIFAFDEAIEGYEVRQHAYLSDCIDAVLGIFSTRTFTAAYRYVRDRHGITR